MKYLINKKKKEITAHRYMVWLCALLLSLAMPFLAFSQKINSEKATSCDTIASSGFDPNKPAANQWEEGLLLNANVECTNVFDRERILLKDRKGCTPDESKAEVAKLRAAIEAPQVVKAVNNVYLSSIRSLSYAEIVAMIQTISAQKELLAELSPLTPIALVLDDSPISLMKTALDGSEHLENNSYLVPAVFLKYGADKIRNHKIEVGTQMVLDLVTIAASSPVAVAANVGKIRRIWAIMEVAGAVGNISVNSQAIDSDSYLGEAIEAYNLAMGVIGVKNLVQTGPHFIKSLNPEVLNRLKNNQGIRDLIAANYIKWNSLTIKLKNPEAYIDAQSSKILISQEGILKQLGGKILRKFDNSEEIKSFLKTDKDKAFFWSGRTNKGKGVIDIALEIAQSKGGNTLEGMLSKYNIEMLIWDASNPQSVKLGEDVSALYASQVSGEVRAILGQKMRPNNIWDAS